MTSISDSAREPFFKEALIGVFRNDLEHPIFAEAPTFVAQIPSGVPKVDSVEIRVRGCEIGQMTEMGVRRDKAALSSGCKPHPAIRSSRKQPEQAWRRRNV